MSNIARIRKAKGLNQTQLADMVGIKQPSISRAEKLDEGVTIGIYMDIAKALEVSLSALFADGRSEAEQILIDAFNSLPPARRDGWLEMARLARSEAEAAHRAMNQNIDPANS